MPKDTQLAGGRARQPDLDPSLSLQDVPSGGGQYHFHLWTNDAGKHRMKKLGLLLNLSVQKKERKPQRQGSFAEPGSIEKREEEQYLECS